MTTKGTMFILTSAKPSSTLTCIESSQNAPYGMITTLDLLNLAQNSPPARVLSNITNQQKHLRDETETTPKARKRRKTEGEEESLKRNLQCRWTKEHDIELYKAVSETGAKKWRDVASKIAGGTVYNKDQCYQRWWRVLTIALEKEVWSELEDDRLLEIICTIGDQDWTKIGQMMNKTAVLCLHRYNLILEDVDCDISAVFRGKNRIKRDIVYSEQDMPAFGSFSE
jgi:hypothetical protein